MSKTAPSALNDSFLSMGLLATLVGTFGRVVGDSMITISAFIGKAPYHDFVSVTFLPLLPILGLGLYWVNKVSIVAVHTFMLSPTPLNLTLLFNGLELETTRLAAEKNNLSNDLGCHVARYKSTDFNSIQPCVIYF